MRIYETLAGAFVLAVTANAIAGADGPARAMQTGETQFHEQASEEERQIVLVTIQKKFQTLRSSLRSGLKTRFSWRND